MANEHVNKVEANGSTLIDLTADTAEASDVVRGKTLHLASGATATGTMDVAGSIANADIDSVVADSAPTGDASLRLTGLSYLWEKIKAKLSGYLPLSGGTVTGNLIVQGATTLGSRRGTSVGANSVAEGHDTAAVGHYSHAEGDGAVASGFGSHAEGYYTEATRGYSHAQNLFTIAASSSQTALGKYNVEDANDTYAAIIGNGGDSYERSNALAVRWDGLVDVGGTAQSDGTPNNDSETCYPTFVRSSWSTSSDESTLPVTPCFVLSAVDNKLFYCSGSGITHINPDTNTVTRVKGNAESAYRTGDVNLTPANIGALALTGGTLDGRLDIKDDSIDRDTAATGSDDWASRSFHILDKNGEMISQLTSAKLSNGVIRTRLVAKNENTDGTEVQNYLDVDVAKNGSCSYKVGDATAFRNAIGASGGVWAVGQVPTLPTSKIEDLGTYENVDVSDAVSVASGTWKVIGHLSGLESGVWVISYGVIFQNNATGRRYIAFDDANDTTGPSAAWLRTSGVNATALSGGQTNLHGCWFVNGNPNRYLKAWQNSGSTLNVTCNIRAVRIK